MIFRPTYTSFRAIPKYCGTVCFGELASANVVGYNSTALTTGKGKLSMIAGSFGSVNGKGFQLNTDMTVSNSKGGDSALNSDTLLMWDPTKAGGAGGYTTFYYYDDGEEAGWCDPATDDYVEKSAAYKNGFTSGAAFWFKPFDAAVKEVTFSGAVADSDIIEPALSSGKQLSMIANAYPVPLKLNDTSVVAFTGLKGGDSALNSDTLLLWDSTKAGGAGGYTTFYYYDDGEEAGWCDPATDDYVEKSAAYKAGFPVGTAFWFKPVSEKTRNIQFKKPF